MWLMLCYACAANVTYTVIASNIVEMVYMHTAHRQNIINVEPWTRGSRGWFFICIGSMMQANISLTIWTGLSSSGEHSTVNISIFTLKRICSRLLCKKNLKKTSNISAECGVVKGTRIYYMSLYIIVYDDLIWRFISNFDWKIYMFRSLTKRLSIGRLDGINSFNCS